MKTIYRAILFVFIIGQAQGQSDEVRKKQFNVKNNLALEGYDAVSYFSGKPLEGESRFKSVHKGLTYTFATQANLNTFEANPDKYEPAYGGWCAYAMGETGEKVKVDPETFTILDGKVYLFYNFWGNNTLKDWKENEKKLKASGDRNWHKYVQ
ncbi:YHS domain-containing (seleno)protein [Chryseolinea lacunae]|uniref:YHS domain-containing protein n=1 Tax=Chryseolinea lacunae TaxID=2801331 RepID=A0ABS1KRJ3_9BACT|nr:YHS domain-containing (seleno)protein [Chryseolinea lacunae]MBL0741872.1 YHS domain-containing protein [Chryseolinea lacunae]